jgi:N-acetylglucosaminyldiphosphoundecaprenol N-acetyl-beta-D-mannosaminyltransferase
MACTTCTVFGVRLLAGGLDDAAADLVARAASRRGGYACLCNVHLLMTATHRTDVASALDGAWGVFADGAPVAWLQRREVPAAERVAGANLLLRGAEAGRAEGLRHFLYGSTDIVLARLQARLESAVPGIAICGSYAPPFEDSPGGLDRIVAAEPHVVWCGLGAPKQELWLAQNAGELAPAVSIGVGAAFDFLAETKARAPVWMQRSGLEWLHRLAAEPRRLGARYARTNSEFLLRAAAELARRRTA